MAHRWVDHTAELELHVTAPTEAAVFEEALQAFHELSAGSVGGAHVSYELELTEPDRATLLARWLDELVYMAETEDLVPEAVERLQLTPDGLAAKVRSRRGEPRHLVKGVTYHRLAFTGGANGYRATVVLDV